MRQLSLAAVFRAFLFALCLAGAPAPVRAAVEISFYSHEFGSNFPHAFITLVGDDERTGERIETDYGFSATRASPAVLMGPVQGEVMSLKPDPERKYLGKSDRHFSIVLTGAEYDAVMATVEKWKTLPQPSYHLNRRNCVYFVADIAAVLGMKSDIPKALAKKPRSYTELLTRTNRDWLVARGATIVREPPAERLRPAA